MKRCEQCLTRVPENTGTHYWRLPHGWDNAVICAPCVRKARKLYREQRARNKARVHRMKSRNRAPRW